MKSTTIAVGVLALVSQLAAAQPHRRHAHADKHVKKDNVVVTIVDTVYAQATAAPNVVVYVDAAGKPVSTTTEGLHTYPLSVWSTAKGLRPTPAVEPTVAPAPVPTTSSSSSFTTFVSKAAPAPVVESSAPAVKAASVEVPAVSSSAPAVIAASVNIPAAVEDIAAPASTTAAAPVVSSSSVAAPAASSAAASSGNKGYGFSYSPYNADSTCKTQDQVNQDFETIGSTYSIVRTYGTDCNQVATILTVAKKYGMKMFAGIYDIAQENLASQVKLISDAANGDWSDFDTISVGNELVNTGAASPATVIAAIGTVRSLLKTAGYTGKVVTVDTYNAMIANPSLCDASDACTANCHPFFDSEISAKDAGAYVTSQIEILRSVISDKTKEIVITETGWPWKGEPNGKAIPSVDNQSAAMSSIKTAFADNPSGVLLFTAFNDPWKALSAATFNAEPYWGIHGDCPSG